MTKIIDYARLSGHVYNINLNPYVHFEVHTASIHKLPTKSGWYRMTDVDPLMLPNHHFFAQQEFN